MIFFFDLAANLESTPKNKKTKNATIPIAIGTPRHKNPQKSNIQYIKFGDIWCFSALVAINLLFGEGSKFTLKIW
jgi:hypothetical protein